MPMDPGYELCRIRISVRFWAWELKDTKDAIVVVWTGSDDFSIAYSLIGAGSSQLLSKSYTPTRLWRAWCSMFRWWSQLQQPPQVQPILVFSKMLEEWFVSKAFGTTCLTQFAWSFFIRSLLLFATSLDYCLATLCLQAASILIAGK